MSEIFGIEGGPQGPGANQNQGAAKKKPQGEGEEQTPDYRAGEGPQGRYMQYDNHMGAMMLNLPPRFAKYKGELQEDLMDEFYGAAAGGKEQHKSIDEWIADWIRRKEEEDPDLIQPDF